MGVESNDTVATFHLAPRYKIRIQMKLDSYMKRHLGHLHDFNIWVGWKSA